jgi:hypothetical protein
MKYEINIEIERTTIIGNYSPDTSDKDGDVIEVTAKELPSETDSKTVKKLKNKEQKNVGI